MSRPPPSLRYNYNKVQTRLFSPLSQTHSTSWALIQSLSSSSPQDTMVNSSQFPHLNPTNGYHPMQIFSDSKSRLIINSLSRKKQKQKPNTISENDTFTDLNPNSIDFLSLFQVWTVNSPFTNTKFHSIENLVSFGFLFFPLVFSIDPELIARNKYTDFRSGFGVLMRKMEYMSYISPYWNFFPFHQSNLFPESLPLLLRQKQSKDGNIKTQSSSSSSSSSKSKVASGISAEKLLSKIKLLEFQFQSKTQTQEGQNPNITQPTFDNTSSSNEPSHINSHIKRLSSQFHIPPSTPDSISFFPFVHSREKFTKLNLKKWFFEWPLQTEYNSRLFHRWSFSLPKRILMMKHAASSIPHFANCEIRTKNLVKWFLTLVPLEQQNSVIDWCQLYPFWENFLVCLWEENLINLSTFWNNIFLEGFVPSMLKFTTVFLVCARFNPLFTSNIHPRLFSQMNPNYSTNNVMTQTRDFIENLYSLPLPTEFDSTFLKDTDTIPIHATSLLFCLAGQKYQIPRALCFDSFHTMFIYSWITMISNKIKKIINFGSETCDSPEIRARNMAQVDSEKFCPPEALALFKSVIPLDQDISPLLFSWQLIQENDIPEISTVFIKLDQHFSFEKWLSRYLNSMDIESPHHPHYCFILAWDKISTQYSIPESILQKGSES